MKVPAIVTALILSLIVGYCALQAFLRCGSSWSALSKDDIGVFLTEEDAAYCGSVTIRTLPPVARLPRGQYVSVLWDTYGKDYWACYVRLPDGVRGWVLCTELEKTA